jgi:hypothetical protein
MPGHVLFGEGERPLCLVLVLLLQNRPAQERQLLEADAIPFGQGQIGLDGKHRASPVSEDTFKREDPESPLLAETIKNKLRLLSFNKHLVQPLRDWKPQPLVSAGGPVCEGPGFESGLMAGIRTIPLSKTELRVTGW